MKILKLCLGRPRAIGNGISKLVINRTRELERQGHEVDIAYFRLTRGLKRRVVESYRESGGRDICLEVGFWLVVLVSGSSLLRLAGRVPVQCLLSDTYGIVFGVIIRRISGMYDICHCYHLRTLGLWSFMSRSPGLVIDLIDSYTLNYGNRLSYEKNWVLRCLVALELLQIRHLEQNMHGWIKDRDKTVILTVAERDRMYVKCGNVARFVVPVGIELDTSTEVGYRETFGKSERLDLVFFGNLDYEPNVTACEMISDIASMTRENVAAFRVGGKNASSRLRKRLYAQGVNVVSPVDEMESFVRGADIAIFPMMSGSGMQSKILEAIAWGCLVIATERIASPLGLRQDQEYIRAETAVQFAEVIEDIHRGERDTDGIREAAFERIKEFRWSKTVEKLLTIYSGTVERL